MVVKACDHCHGNKEKCSFADNQLACARCRHLNIVCTVSRRHRRLGRRPAAKSFPHGIMQVWGIEDQERSKPKAQECGVSPHAPITESTSRMPTDIKDGVTQDAITAVVPPAPERLLAAPADLRTISDALRTVEDVQQFAVIHMPFMLGTTFALDCQRAVHTILRFSAPTLTEGYLAFLGLMTRHQSSLVLHKQSPDLEKAAKGLQRLRSVTVTHDYDAACALFLGQAMYVFDILTTANSSTAHSIMRSAMISAQQWYPRLINFPAMDTVIICPILVDTTECLARREIPVIRLTLPDRIIVDRYAGLCSTLLPLLYDLCALSNARKNIVNDTTSETDPGDDWLGDVEQKIKDWKPVTPPTFYTDHGKHETLIMMTQARVYRLAGLLVIHRLRFPFGVEDEAAKGLASSIFSEMFSFARSPGKDSTALPVVFPLIVAMFEVEGPGEEILGILSSFTVQGLCAAKLQGFVKQVRAFRKSGFRGTWFDLVETHLNAAMVP
ncbi:hypothetical protein ASPVEDRAFT_887279 [Aspergillus versicolor CBS 583.65]|uniref:Zn(2)-C6 fungal-type domain-containing protein n=1 Tax=Aspergillus versicolor CBS 583.65 TaxID=1036611 RepID=A0A1L9PK52_ASPVE|nr:uncharacterized protein ASPVEDRAFT_887279 [Aspergillus versicolor CBS 583.65]OJJ01871.1 hypothetical protein ASPVEDRAFT_887279 [Aspergillus versicolor CBS 583.65]